MEFRYKLIINKKKLNNDKIHRRSGPCHWHCGPFVACWGGGVDRVVVIEGGKEGAGIVVQFTYEIGRAHV